MPKTVVILATLDTKSEEAQYLSEQITSLGGQATVVDIGVIGEPSVKADVTHEAVATADPPATMPA